MRASLKCTVGLVALWWPLFCGAEGEQEVREAVSALARTSYAWETTIRQRFRGETAEPKLEAKAAVEVHGRIDPQGYLQITQAASRDVAGPVTAVFRLGDVVVHTPLGWLRRNELRARGGADREMEFEGKKVRLSRVLAVANKVTAMRPVTEELFDLLGDAKSWRTVQGLVVAELRDGLVEQLWGDAQARRAPEIHGSVIFKLSEEGVTEYHVVLGIGFPNDRTKKIAWSMQQWSTRISGIGTTSVEPPEGAVRALEQ